MSTTTNCRIRVPVSIIGLKTWLRGSASPLGPGRNEHAYNIEGGAHAVREVFLQFDPY